MVWIQLPIASVPSAVVTKTTRLMALVELAA